MQQLRAEAERCKIALSVQASVECAVPTPHGTPSATITVTLSLDDLLLAAAPVLERLWLPMQRLGADYQLAYAHRPDASARSQVPAAQAGQARFAPPLRTISQLVLVGGATKSPVVAAFAERVCGVAACMGVDPEHSVALGAAIQAGIMDGSVAGGLEMMDSLYVQELQGRVSGFQS